MALLKLSPPWNIFYKKLDCLFKKDDEVKVIFDEDNNEIILYVDNRTKAEALTELLYDKKEFGNVSITINVVPSDTLDFRSRSDSIYKDAFNNNPVFSDVINIKGIFDITYVLFKKEVAQYWTDNLSDAHGVCSTLYEDIARDIFKPVEGVYFCTDVDDSFIFAPKNKWTISTNDNIIKY